MLLWFHHAPCSQWGSLARSMILDTENAAVNVYQPPCWVSAGAVRTCLVSPLTSGPSQAPRIASPGLQGVCVFAPCFPQHLAAPECSWPREVRVTEGEWSRGAVSACGQSLSDTVLCGRLSVRYPLVSNFKCMSWSSVSVKSPLVKSTAAAGLV